MKIKSYSPSEILELIGPAQTQYADEQPSEPPPDAQCDEQQVAGGDTPDTRTVELGQTSGSFDFEYETLSQEDQIIVRYEGAVLFDTGCVGDNGIVTLNYSGSSSQITVEVIPNCNGGSGTAWDYTVNCPNL